MPLAGGDVTEGVVRVGDTVRRPRGPWSSSVAAYLRHLERVGFEGAPRFLGIDEQGRDVLDFVPGEVPGQPVVEPWAATPAVLAAIAELLGRLHVASSSFVPPPGACWFGDDVSVDFPAEVGPEPPADYVCHLDVTPQNVVFRDGLPVALVDFDLARPAARLRDVVNTAMWWVQLFRRPTATPRSRRARFPRDSRHSRTRMGSIAPGGRRSATSRSTVRAGRGTGCGRTRRRAAAAGPGCGPRAPATGSSAGGRGCSTERPALEAALGVR